MKTFLQFKKIYFLFLLKMFLVHAQNEVNLDDKTASMVKININFPSLFLVFFRGFHFFALLFVNDLIGLGQEIL